MAGSYGGRLIVGHLKPLVIGSTLAKVLDLLVNDQDPHLTSCPQFGLRSALISKATLDGRCRSLRPGVRYPAFPVRSRTYLKQGT